MIAHHARRSLIVPGLIAFGLLVSACGTSQVANTTSTSSSTTAPASSTSSTSPSGASGPSGAPACSTGVLQVAASFGGAAAGSSNYTITLTNSGPSECSLDGYPKLQFFGPSGAGGAGGGPALEISIEQAGPPPSDVTLKPKQAAESLLLFTDVGASCLTVASALLTPPGSSESLPLPLSLTPCGGIVRVYAFGANGSESP